MIYLDSSNFETLEATLKTFIAFLIFRFILITAIFWGTSALLIELYLPGFWPMHLLFAVVLFLVMTAYDISDIKQAASRHQVPTSWIVQAIYTLQWSEKKTFYHMRFEADFVNEMEKRGLEYKPKN